MKQDTVEIIGANKKNEWVKRLFFWRVNEEFLAIYVLEKDKWKLLGEEKDSRLIFATKEDIQFKMMIKCRELLKGLN